MAMLDHLDRLRVGPHVDVDMASIVHHSPDIIGVLPSVPEIGDEAMWQRQVDCWSRRNAQWLDDHVRNASLGDQRVWDDEALPPAWQGLFHRMDWLGETIEALGKTDLTDDNSMVEAQFLLHGIHQVFGEQLGTALLHLPGQVELPEDVQATLSHMRHDIMSPAGKLFLLMDPGLPVRDKEMWERAVVSMRQAYVSYLAELLARTVGYQGLTLAELNSIGNTVKYFWQSHSDELRIVRSGPTVLPRHVIQVGGWERILQNLLTNSSAVGVQRVREGRFALPRTIQWGFTVDFTHPVPTVYLLVADTCGGFDSGCFGPNGEVRVGKTFREGGSGQGLTIIRDIVAECGGHVRMGNVKETAQTAPYGSYTLIDVPLHRGT